MERLGKPVPFRGWTPCEKRCVKGIRWSWKPDCLGHDLRDLVNTVQDLPKHGVGFKVPTGHRAAIDTTTTPGKLIFSNFAVLAEFERELMSERQKAGLESASARGRKGGAPAKMTASKVRLAMAAMGQ